MLPLGADQQIDLLTYPMKVVNGRTLPDTSQDPTEVAVTGCLVQPGAVEIFRSPDQSSRTNVPVRWTVWAPAGTQVTSYHAARYNGRIYQMDSQPETWDTPGMLAHVVIRLIDWEG